MAILRMENPVRNYDWGSVTEIPRLAGVENSGGKPVAELWMGAHPGAPSAVMQNGRGGSLAELIGRDPERWIGGAVTRRFGARLPFLFKILSAARALSIQAHPNQAQAARGFARENKVGIPLDAPDRSYRDDNHKPELIRALTRFFALRGFRPYRDILTELSVPEFDFLHEPVAAMRRRPDGRRLAALFEALMRSEAPRVADAARRWASRAKEEAADTVDTDGGTAEDGRYTWVLRLYEQFGEDRGIAAPLFLNVVELAPGEAMFLPAGTLHAYLEGTAVELMANSDNVLRGGLTRKHVDIEELLRILVFEPDEPVVRRAGNGTAADNVRGGRGGVGGGAGRWRRHAVSVEEFSLEEADVSGALERSRRRGTPEIVLPIGGEIMLEESDGREGRLRLSSGRSAFVTAETGSYRVSGDALVFVATVPLEGEPS
ncbi:MAG: mannose-6-phosphate isomerase, class I [Spirochaetaceae bacterium]